MKKILSLVAGMAVVLTFGVAYAEDSMSGTQDNGDNKMIRDEDISHSNLDQDKGTVNQMPGGTAEGSGAGGVSKDSDSMSKPVDKSPAAPAEGSDTGGGTKEDSGSWGY